MSDSVRPHRRQPTRLPCPWDSPGKNTGVGCHFLLQCMKVKSESEVAQSCPTLATPWTAAYQAPPSMGFSRQEYWSGVPLPFNPVLKALAAGTSLVVQQVSLQASSSGGVGSVPGQETKILHALRRRCSQRKKKSRGTETTCLTPHLLFSKQHVAPQSNYFCFFNAFR